ncbi:hypothetical protein LR48_Vigan393s001000 [Vigna angularis]|uniref:Uncharacterized protein n=1 Tax=Phaseolus angularis TaxID=3914 RepID=A0A0L9T9N2_PHAAN|nr:hypothetical protein LR48_Vigan393s001000 [Vigna angularis]
MNISKTERYLSLIPNGYDRSLRVPSPTVEDARPTVEDARSARQRTLVQQWRTLVQPDSRRSSNSEGRSFSQTVDAQQREKRTLVQHAHGGHSSRNLRRRPARLAVDARPAKRAVDVRPASRSGRPLVLMEDGAVADCPFYLIVTLGRLEMLDVQGCWTLEGPKSPTMVAAANVNYSPSCWNVGRCSLQTINEALQTCVISFQLEWVVAASASSPSLGCSFLKLFLLDRDHHFIFPWCCWKWLDVTPHLLSLSLSHANHERPPLPSFPQ